MVGVSPTIVRQQHEHLIIKKQLGKLQTNDTQNYKSMVGVSPTIMRQQHEHLIIKKQLGKLQMYNTQNYFTVN